MENPENQNIPPLPPLATRQPSGLVKGIVVLLLIVISYGLGMKTGQKGFTFKPKSFQIVNQANQPQTVNYQLLWDAINILNTKFIDKPLDQQKILYGAIRGAVAAAGDPYTVYFEPKDLQSFQTTLKGNFDGIGAEIGQRNGVITVISPLDGSPAQKAGILAKDIVAAVNGKSTQDWTVDQAVNAIRGQKGTQVTLTIVREGKDKPFDLKITRENIAVKSVKWAMKDTQVNGKTKHIEVITLSQFGDDTKDLFNQAVNDALQHSADGIVLDLRNDPGGYLQTAVDVASAWVDAGKTVVTEAHSDGTNQVYKAEGNDRLHAIKTVVLINGGSASAAEILSGALHDNNQVELIGEKSFGKGSVQELTPMTDGSAVKVTVAKWITPGGVNLNHNGLDPDVKVTLTEDNISKGQDPQMDKAMEEVTK